MSLPSHRPAVLIFLAAVALSLLMLVLAFLGVAGGSTVAFLGGLAAASAFWLGLLSLADEDPDDPEDPADGPGPDPGGLD